MRYHTCTIHTHTHTTHTHTHTSPFPTASAPAYQGDPVFELSLGMQTSMKIPLFVDNQPHCKQQELIVFVIPKRHWPPPLQPYKSTLCKFDYNTFNFCSACSSLVGSLCDCVPSAMIVTSVMTPPQAYWIRYAQTEVVEVSLQTA